VSLQKVVLVKSALIDIAAGLKQMMLVYFVEKIMGYSIMYTLPPSSMTAV
jgi:hypothetical protein